MGGGVVVGIEFLVQRVLEERVACGHRHEGVVTDGCEEECRGDARTDGGDLSSALEDTHSTVGGAIE